MEEPQIQHSHDDITMAKDVFLSCATLQARMEGIEVNTRLLIEDTILGNASRIEATLAQIVPVNKHEFELMAQVIVLKALDEPQHCKSCVSLAGAFQVLLPPLPSGKQGKKGETFMHALLDVFQTEFELCMSPHAQKTSDKEEQTGAILANQNNQPRIRAIVHLAGHLHCNRLLGKGVVSQLLHDLVEIGLQEAANELLWFIGIVANNAAQPRHLGTVLEDAGDSDGASSEKDQKERHP